MIPTLDDEADARRVPVTGFGGDLEARELERCSRNVVILVHGHNEEERTGDPRLESAPGPWRFVYKRDVWSHLYGAWLAADPSAARCTAFYELIYPTFRPIFSEPGAFRERLDESFARLLQSELVDPGPGAMPDNVYVVAHSMGGLVARAGLQLVDPEIARRVRRVVTWGTPHLGSPLVSLRMALAAAPPYRVNEAFVASKVQSLFGALATQAAADAGWQWMRGAVTALQVDSPGTRDLRWARLYPDDPHGLALDQVLATTAAQQGLEDTLDLGRGLELYSDNTTSLDVADALSPREVYSFFYGTTAKRVSSLSDATEIALGATVLEWIVARPADTTRGELNGSSDGAVSVASLMGEGLGAERVDLDDVDHEEYFGAPYAESPRPDLGLLTADTTIDRLRITTDEGVCPQVEARIDVPGVRPLRLDGRLVWPSEPSPGWRLASDQVFVVGVGSARPPLRLDAVETSADGNVHGTFDPPDLGEGVTRVRLRLVLVGGAVLESPEV
ncbi:MAG: hypothetical protein IT379_13740, partial [Deltaproteobacteria bacterium]|nr:hypothetical protein [Deltaproteobacteria bacterium]